MTKRELESMAWKLKLFLSDGGFPCVVFKGGGAIAHCKTKRELELFLQGVIVGKEMG